MFFSSFKNILTFIRFSHTIFAMPFALGAMLIAADDFPGWSVVWLVLICLVTARTAAMAFNRLVDWEIDKENPRTENRHRLVEKRIAWCLTWGCVCVFVAATYFLNWLCFALAPIAVLLIFFYSLTKRFTAFSHAFLGFALAAAPMGAWAAVDGNLLAWPPWILAAAVMVWVFGFDLIYATRDTEFDRTHGLYSFPAKFGNEAALKLARSLHGLAWLLLGLLGFAVGFGWCYWTGWILVAGALVYEHCLARTGDVKKVNKAFFQANAFVGAVFLGSIVTEVCTMN